jgi:hypothetical protein
MPTALAPVPPGIGDDFASNGEWEISSISPQAGYVDNANSVTIRGSFPTSAYVWFGGQPGQVVYQTEELITVRTPLRSAEGVVDVSLRATGAGTVLTVPGAFAFVAWGSAPPIVGSPGREGTNGDSTNGGGGGSNDGESGGDSGSGDAGNGSGAQTSGDRRPRMTVGSAVDLPSGLRGAAITPNPAANTTVCSTDPCRAIRRS